MSYASGRDICTALQRLGILPDLQNMTKVVLTVEAGQGVKLDVSLLAPYPLDVPIIKQFKVESIDGN